MYQPSSLPSVHKQAVGLMQQKFPYVFNITCLNLTDIPQNPGPILLQENVPNAVTVTWEPSASEKWERNLYYTVLKRESQKGVWHVVGDLIYTNKFTYTQVIPGRDYYFRVVAKNELGSSGPSETVQPWRIKKTKGKTAFTYSYLCNNVVVLCSCYCF